MRHCTRAAAFALLGLTIGCPAAEMMAPPPTLDELAYDCNHLPAGLTTVASDESFRAISDAVDATGLVVDDTRAPHLTAPATGTPLSASVPPRFEFQSSLALIPRGAPATPPGALAPPPARRPRWHWRWLSPIGVAWAHCPAVTGDNYLFRLESGGHVVYTALLSVTAFTPDPTKWQAALQTHVGSDVTLSIARAYLLQGRVIEGPYVGSTRATFRIAP